MQRKKKHRDTSGTDTGRLGGVKTGNLYHNFHIFYPSMVVIDVAMQSQPTTGVNVVTHAC